MTQIILLIILIAANAFFAAAEIAFISLNDAKIDLQIKEGNKKAKKIKSMIINPSKFLATIQIGITLAGFLASAFAAEAFADEIVTYFYFLNIDVNILKAITVIIVTLILSYFTLVFGELVPKRIAMSYPDKIAYTMVGFITLLMKITYPFVFILTKSTNIVSKLFGCKNKEENKITEEEIKAIILNGRDEGVVEEGEKDLIFNVFSFNDTEAKDIMTPRKDVISINVDTSKEELMSIIKKSKFTRMPVFDKENKTVIGILNIKDIIIYHKKYKRLNILDIIHKPIFVNKNDKADDIFRLMQQKNQAIAIVKDEDNSVIGIITMEDAIEEIVGNIFDEFDLIKEE